MDYLNYESVALELIYPWEIVGKLNKNALIR